MYFFNLALADFGDAIEDKARCNAVGDAVAKSHKDARKEGGNGFFQIVPLNFLKGRHHHYTYRYQRRRRSRGGDSAYKRSQERADYKAQRNYHAGKTCASARAYARGAFNICGGIGSAEYRAYGSGGSIRKQGLVHLGFKAGRSIHSLLVLIAEDARAAACAYKSADCVKSIRNTERENSD